MRRPVENRFVCSVDSRLSADATRMALVTVDAVVHIPVYVRVLEIVRVIVAMAARALEDRVVTTVNVARGALAACVAVAG